jgi:hypothetical protein
MHNNIDNDGKEKTQMIQDLVDSFNVQFGHMHKLVLLY